MKRKFVAFSEFTQQTLPHEIAYLLQVQLFEDPERFAILQRMQHNCEPLLQPLPFDESIDKRKYSHLKNWIQQRLATIDVDVQYEWLSQTDFAITTGTLTQDVAQQIIRKIEYPEGPPYHFTKWYNLLRNYRQFLLTHMQYEMYGIVMEYLNERKLQYQKAEKRQEQLHLALIDVVRYYNHGEGDSTRWEDWLNSIYFDSQLDGQSRYEAFTQLTILHVAKRNFDKLEALLDAQEEDLQKGQLYSRRMLIKYYANRLILCNQQRQLEAAERFGYLSLRGSYAESLQYRSNLAAVLLRMRKLTEARQLLRVAFPQMKQSERPHDKINFVSMYLRTLFAQKEYAQGERYADAFLKGNAEMVMAHNWHTFFHTYCKGLLWQEKNTKVLRLIRKFDLLTKEGAQVANQKQLPVLQWFTLAAKYKEQKLGKASLIAQLHESLRSIPQVSPSKAFQFLASEIGDLLPLVTKALRSKLSQ